MSIERYFNYDTPLADVDLDDWSVTVDAFSKRITVWFFVERVTGHEAFMAMLGAIPALNSIHHFLGLIGEKPKIFGLSGKEMLVYNHAISSLYKSGGLPQGVAISGTDKAYTLHGSTHVFDPWVICNNIREWLLDACDIMRDDPNCQMSKALRTAIESAKLVTGD